MPELPDILAYLKAMESRVLNRTLIRIRLGSPFILRTVDPTPAEVEGKKITGLYRLGKRIVIGLEGDLFLVIHLMIAGRLHWRAPGAKLGGKMNLAAFDFEDGSLVLTEAGSKRRASLYIIRGAEGLREHQKGGLEVIDASFDDFRAALLRENHTLKRALTDPRLFSGIGNSYSDEILHRSGLSPIKLTGKLEEQEILSLYDATRDVLREWIDRLESEAAEGFPEKVTAFRKGMAVHGRYGHPCPACGTPIQRIVYADNESNYCPTCQTGGKLLADRALSRLLKSDWPRSIAELEESRSKGTGNR